MNKIIPSLIIGSIFGSLLSCSSRPSVSEQEQWEKQCTPIISWLESEYAKNKRYPESLPDKYASILNSFRVQAEYRSFDEGLNFSIGIGDYANYGWVYYYEKREDKRTSWMIDS
jgi:hypothetical protein